MSSESNRDIAEESSEELADRIEQFCDDNKIDLSEEPRAVTTLIRMLRENDPKSARLTFLWEQDKIVGNRLLCDFLSAIFEEDETL